MAALQTPPDDLREKVFAFLKQPKHRIKGYTAEVLTEYLGLRQDQEEKVRTILQTLAAEKQIHEWRQWRRTNFYSISKKPRNLESWQMRHGSYLDRKTVFKKIRKHREPISVTLIRFELDDWRKAPKGLSDAIKELMKAVKIKRSGTRHHFKYSPAAALAKEEALPKGPLTAKEDEFPPSSEMRVRHRQNRRLALSVSSDKSWLNVFQRLQGRFNRRAAIETVSMNATKQKFNLEIPKAHRVQNRPGVPVRLLRFTRLPGIGRVFFVLPGEFVLLKAVAKVRLFIFSPNHAACTAMMIKAIDPDGNVYIGHAHARPGYGDVRGKPGTAYAQIVNVLDYLKARQFKQVQIQLNVNKRWLDGIPSIPQLEDKIRKYNFEVLETIERDRWVVADTLTYSVRKLISHTHLDQQPILVYKKRWPTTFKRAA